MPVNDQKRAFFRSLVSVAASIMILAGAIYLGGLEQTQSKRFNPESSPYLVAAPLQTIFSNSTTELVTRDEQIQISKGMMLMGAPGALGRLGLIPDLAASFHQSR